MNTYKIDSSTTLHQDAEGHWTGDLYDGMVKNESLLESEVIDMIKKRAPEMIKKMFPMYGFSS